KQQLQHEYDSLNKLYVNISQLNRQLCGEVAQLRQQMADDPSFIGKRDQLLELTNLNGIIENLYCENKLLQTKCDTFASKETRLKSEIDNLHANQRMLEDCLKKEAENAASLKSFYSSTNTNEQIISESAQKFRSEKDKLERE